MRPAPSTPVAAIAVGTALCAIGAAAVGAATALGVALTGLTDAARSTLGFGFGGLDPSASDVAAIAVHNGRLAAGALLLAAVVPRLPRLARTFADVILLAILALNAGAIGAAIGAYGPRLIEAVALHLPLELGALSLAGGAYMHARQRPIGTRALATLAAACALLLIAAATVETYTSPRGPG